MKDLKEKKEKTANVLLEIGSLMMISGANTERIRVSLQRISSAWGYNIDVMITHRALLITLVDKYGEFSLSKIKRIQTHAVNMRIVTGISHMSWHVSVDNWTVEDVILELERFKKLPKFNRLVVLFFIGLSDLSFCYLFSGDLIAMLVSFVSTIIGLWVRQETAKMHSNPFVSILCAAFAASFLSQIAYLIPSCTTPDAAFATSVLFLIPGVHLVNSVTDLIDGNFQKGVTRGMNALLMSFSIAFGMMLSKVIYSFFI